MAGKEKYLRADGSFTMAAFRMVESWAADNKTQRTIAAELGIPYRAFEAALNKNKGDNELRLAWERGHAVVEQDMADSLFTQAKGDGKGAMIAAIFYSKARLGWTDKDPVGPTTPNNIQIVLPAAMSREEYYKALGISGPIDSRQAAKDVTPDLPALPGVAPK